jgi:UDP-N-acetylglucosamine 2-epimerase (hydrolysing)
MSNTLVCHIEGGEVSGTIDEAIRHATSKLSHIHMVSNEEAAARLRSMGEAAADIYVIGRAATHARSAPARCSRAARQCGVEAKRRQKQ